MAISENHGKPHKSNNIMVFPTFHPAAAIRFPKIKALMKKDFKELEILLLKIG